MATLEQLSAERRQAIAAIVGRKLGLLPNLFANRLSLAESLPVWVWLIEAGGENARLQVLATQTSRWHHQVAGTNAARIYVTTIEGEPEAATASTVSYGSLGLKIDAAITWADEHITDDAVARLLFIPQLSMHCLWFERSGEDLLLVVDAPIGTIEELTIVLPEAIRALAAQSQDDWADA